MQSSKQFSRLSTAQLKLQIARKLGRVRAENYFADLKKLLGLKISKTEFDKRCLSTLGKEHIALHNLFIRSILKNVYLANAPPKKVNTLHSSDSTISNSNVGEVIPSPRKEVSVNSRLRRVTDRPSPLGPHGKVQTGNTRDRSNSCDLQRPQECILNGSKVLLEVASVETGEEVEQVSSSPGIQSKSPLRPPLGISVGRGAPRRKRILSNLQALCSSDNPTICHDSYILPDDTTLKKQLEQKLAVEGLRLSDECVSLLNSGLDAYLKQLIKPCMDIARARSDSERIDMTYERISQNIGGNFQRKHLQQSKQSFSASLTDFQVAMESNPHLLGEEWPLQLEKISLHPPE